MNWINTFFLIWVQNITRKLLRCQLKLSHLTKQKKKLKKRLKSIKSSFSDLEAKIVTAPHKHHDHTIKRAKHNKNRKKKLAGGHNNVIPKQNNIHDFIKDFPVSHLNKIKNHLVFDDGSGRNETQAAGMFHVIQ